jgi:hypothetical protein
MVAIITKTRKLGSRNKIKSCNGPIATNIWGSWSPYIGQEVSAYFRPQTSKFRLYSWHFRHRNLDFRLAVFTINFCAHRPKPSFSRVSVISLNQNVKFRTFWWKSSNILTCLSICSLIWSVIIVNKSFYIAFSLPIWQEIYVLWSPFLYSHYVNGVLCKMLLRVAVYCYFFVFV